MDSFKTKYGLITQGIRRYYQVPITKRVYGYERSWLVYLKLENLELRNIPWKKALYSIGKYLQENHAKPLGELFSFKTDWSKGIVFSDHEFQKNCDEIMSGLWFNTGYASNHGIMIVQDLIKYYEIDPNECEMIVHLPSMSEPPEVINYFKTKLISQFEEYLLDENLSKETCGSVIRSIGVLNKVLVKLNFGANDFFLIDDRVTLSTLKSKCLQYCRLNQVFNNKQMEMAERFLNYYTDFFREYEIMMKTSEVANIN